MEFTCDEKIRGIRDLIDALFQHVLYDEEPLFIGDEATMLDLSAAPADEILNRCTRYYRTAVSLHELRQPLWQVLPDLERRRQVSSVL